MTHTYLVLLPISHLSPRMPVPGCAPVMNPSSTPCQPMLSAVDSDARIDVVGAARLAAQPPTPSYLWSDEAPDAERDERTWRQGAALVVHRGRPGRFAS